MKFLNALGLRLGAAAPQQADGRSLEDDGSHRDPKRLFLVIGLGALSWVATYVGMLELIEANLGDLPFIHKIIIGFSVAMLMTMIIWLLDQMFAPVDAFTRVCYIAGYLFLSIISVGFGFGFYWKVLESRGEASRSAESAITQVQSSLFAASTRLEQLQSTLDQLTTVSSEKAEVERDSGKSCPNSGPGDGPRRKMREDDAGRFKFASDFVKGRVGTVKSDMARARRRPAEDRQGRPLGDRCARPATATSSCAASAASSTSPSPASTPSAPTRSSSRSASTSADRAEKTTIIGAKGVVISCPDGQLQMALRGVVRAIDQLPELEKPKIAAVEGSEATIEAFRRLTTTFFGLLSFKLPPSADELRELQKQGRAVGRGLGRRRAGAPQRAAYREQAAGLAKRDYVPLAVAIFVDLCLLLVSIGRPINRFVGLERSMREAETGPVYPILARFHDIHADADAVRHFEVFRDVIFDVNGQYHVAVPLNIPRTARTTRRWSARRTARQPVLRAGGPGHPERPMSFLPALVVQRQLKRRGSKFVECYGNDARRPLKRGWDAPCSRCGTRCRDAERPAFKVYRFKKGAWPEMILEAVMGAPRNVEPARVRRASDYSSGAAGYVRPNGHTAPPRCIRCTVTPGTAPNSTADMARAKPSAAIGSATRSRRSRPTVRSTIRPRTATGKMRRRTASHRTSRQSRSARKPRRARSWSPTSRSMCTRRRLPLAARPCWARSGARGPVCSPAGRTAAARRTRRRVRSPASSPRGSPTGSRAIATAPETHPQRRVDLSLRSLAGSAANHDSKPRQEDEAGDHDQ